MRLHYTHQKSVKGKCNLMLKTLLPCAFYGPSWTASETTIITSCGMECRPHHFLHTDSTHKEVVSVPTSKYIFLHNWNCPWRTTSRCQKYHCTSIQEQKGAISTNACTPCGWIANVSKIVWPFHLFKVLLKLSPLLHSYPTSFKMAKWPQN